jgi:radical SAM protein with 4Fe4S-binding SPASM domain
MGNELTLQEIFMEKAKRNLIPLNVTFEIILACPLKCRHCYNFDRQAPKTTPGQLSPEETEGAIIQLAKAGAMNISFTGGEPLLSPYLERYVRTARDHHYITTLKTNALLFTESKVEALKSAGLNDIEISLYGATDETYKRFTDVGDGHTKVTANIDLLIARGYKPEINLIIHRENVDELTAMIEFVEKRALKFQVSLEITDRQDGTKTNDYVLTRKQYVQLMTGPHKELFLGDNPEGGLQCPCAVTNCAVSASGDVYPCIGAPIKAGNIRENPFAHIWQNSEVFRSIRGIKITDFKDCYNCEDRFVCQRSSGSAYLNTGNYTGKDPRTCEVSRIRHDILKGRVL